MKTVAMVLAALALTAPLASTAAENKAADKDVCLLYSANCPEQTDTILEKIAKLQHEIARGKIVYSPVEITRLESKLEEYRGLLDSLLSGGD